MSETNIFRHYKQTENQFTNDLFAILELSQEIDDSFIADFFTNCLQIELPKGKLSFKVLGDQEGGHTDARISAGKLQFLVESKINPQSLRENQIKSHLKNMKKRDQKLKRLILLTPDSDESFYIKQFRMINQRMILHLSWKKVYEYLKSYVDRRDQSLFVKLVSQYLHTIKARILDQDFIGVIQKISLKITSRDYLEEMRKGTWKWWAEPSYCSWLDGPGRKLMLYDPEKKALTAEWEIKKLEKNMRRKFPYRYIFTPKSLRIYNPPVPLRHIERIEGFETFGKERSPVRNLTREQYDKLMKDVKVARR